MEADANNKTQQGGNTARTIVTGVVDS